MAKLALIYGMRLLPEEDLGEVRDATIVLKNGHTARVPMHWSKASKEGMKPPSINRCRLFLKCIRKFDVYPIFYRGYRQGCRPEARFPSRRGISTYQLAWLLR